MFRHEAFNSEQNVSGKARSVLASPVMLQIIHERREFRFPPKNRKPFSNARERRADHFVILVLRR